MKNAQNGECEVLPYYRQVSDQTLEIIEHLREGLTYGEISLKLRVTRSTVAGVAARVFGQQTAARMRRGSLNTAAHRKTLSLVELSATRQFAVKEVQYPDKVAPSAMSQAMEWANQRCNSTYTREELCSPCRKAPLVRFRMHVAAFLRYASKWSFPKIGYYLGGRDHSSIMHLVEKYDGLILAAEKSHIPHADNPRTDRIAREPVGASM